MLILAGVLLLFYDGEYRRLKHEKMEHMDDTERQQLNGNYEPPEGTYNPNHSALPDDSNLVRVTDNSHDNSAIASYATNSTNIWVRDEPSSSS